MLVLLLRTQRKLPSLLLLLLLLLLGKSWIMVPLQWPHLLLTMLIVSLLMRCWLSLLLLDLRCSQWLLLCMT